MLSSVRAYVGRHHIGLLALFIALGGTSYAAIKLPANSVGAKQLKKGAVTPPKVARSTRRIFKGQKGARGPMGTRGPTGARGATGASGAPGSPAAGTILGSLNANGSLYYANPAEEGEYVTSAPDDTYAVVASPNTTMVARDLFVRIDPAPGGVESVAVALRVNHADTPFACTVTGAATKCDGGSTTVTVPPGSLLSMKVQRSGAVAADWIYWGFRLTTP
jgi:hypothetical protein